MSSWCLVVALVISAAAGDTEGEPPLWTEAATNSFTTTTRDKRNLFKQDSLAQREGEPTLL